MTITLPTSHLGQNGICYVGVRASDNEPWRYTRLNENGQVMLSNRFLRASSEKISSQYSFGLYRTNLQLALFVYNEEKEEQSESISADSFTATTTAVIAKKDGAYSEDLSVIFTITGLNLDRIKASDLTALVTYKSNSRTPVTIKANGTNCTYVSSGESDAAVDGKDYFAHSFKIGSLNSESSMSGVAKYSFTLNLNGVKLEDFKPEFLLEIGCDSNITGLIPFSYAGYMKFEAKDSSEPEPEPQPEPTPTPTPGVTYTLDLLKGKGIATVTGAGSYEAGTSVTVSCTMQEGYEFANWTGDITTEHFNMPAKNATMTANATPISYSITYDLASGTLEEGKTNPATYSIESSLITLNNPTRDGYVFIGWTGTDIEEGTATTTVKIAAGSTGDRSYVASYTSLKYVNKLTKINDNYDDQIMFLKGFGRGYLSYNSSLTAVEAWNLAKYQAEKDGVTVYVIMSSQDDGFDIHYAVSSDVIATENNTVIYNLCDEDNGKRMYYVAQ